MRLCAFPWAILALVLAMPALSAGAAEGLLERRAAADALFAAELEALATRCDELKLPEQARATRAWAIPRDGNKRYVFFPGRAGLAVPPASATGVVEKWQAKLAELRRQQAARLFALAREAAATQRDLSLQWASEALYEDPDHAAARSLWGFTKVAGGWREPGTVSPPRAARLPHPVFGWPAGKYWRFETPHFDITTSHSPAEGMRLGEQLEELHGAWRQVFPEFWISAADLEARLAGARPPAEPLKKFRVVLFRNREEYGQKLAAVSPHIGATLGIYLDHEQLACFFAGEAQAEATWRHEAVHQIFQETSRAPAGLARRGHMAFIEGVALYFESLERHTGYGTLGGIEAPRLQFARYRSLLEQGDLPLAELAALNRQQLQEHPKRAQLYSQAAGVTHFLLHGQGGKWRAPLAKYLAAVYHDSDLPAADCFRHLGARPEELEAAYRAFLQVTDDDLRSLARTRPRLTHLALGRTAVTPSGLAALAEHTAELEWLDLAFTPATDAALAHFAPAVKLRQLNLEATHITDRGLGQIAQFRNLEELDLAQTSITDAGLAELARLSRLKVLWVTGTPLTDAAVETLARLKSLEVLGVKSTRLSPAALAQLNRALPKLQRPLGE